MMNARLLLLLVFAGIFSNYAAGQKIKYKDLYYLLNAKKYDEAEPFLKSYLSNPKDSDDPNANFQMGIIYHEKSKGKDILKDSDSKITYIDSAVIYYEKAKGLIDEKEIKKNDEYYEDYYRRDLRTGKMGIKLSDIHLDIETRIGDLNKHKGRIADLNSLFDKTLMHYESAQKTYMSLVEGYSSQEVFCLQSGQETIEKLKKLRISYDSAMGYFGHYKIVLSEIEFPGYDQSLAVQQIADIAKDGISEADFYSSNVKIWDYEKWQKEVLRAIENDVLPIQERLVLHDKALNELYDKLNHDSVSVVDDLAALDFELTLSNLKKYNSKPLPKVLFELKKKELLYLSKSIEALSLSDSANIDKSLKLVEAKMEQLDVMDSLLNNEVADYDLAIEALNYKPLIEGQYGGEAGLNTFVANKKEMVSENKLQLESQLSALQEQSKWLIYESDSIPLVARDSSTALNTVLTKKAYVHLGKKTIADTTSFAFGLAYSPEKVPALYVSKIPPSHQLNALKELEVNATAFAYDSLAGIGTKAIKDNFENTYILMYSNRYFDTPLDAHMLKVKNDGTVAWNKPITLIYPPDVLTVSTEFGVLGVNYDVQYIDKSKGLQLISRELYDMNTGEKMSDKN